MFGFPGAGLSTLLAGSIALNVTGARAGVAPAAAQMPAATQRPATAQAPPQGPVETPSPAEAPAAPPAPRPPAAGRLTDRGGLHVDFTVMNAFDGNLNRQVVPLASYGLAPGAALRYDASRAFAWDYAIALNEYTGTDHWDRLSHLLAASMHHGSGRVRSETRAEGTWKVPSDDRELTKQAELSERLTVHATRATSLQFSGAYRYKYYVDHPDSSGPSPYVGARVDRRVGRRGLAFAYRFQTRQSRLRSDRYYRHGYATTFSTPLAGAGDELSISAEYRPQVYQGLVRTNEALEPRRDRRMLLNATYERPLSPRMNLLWLAGYQRRWSNDRSKTFVEPILALTIRYRWR